jgi:hypothetical protein
VIPEVTNAEPAVVAFPELPGPRRRLVALDRLPSARKSVMSEHARAVRPARAGRGLDNALLFDGALRRCRSPTT